MNGYEPIANRIQPEFWRELKDSTVATLAEALALLPPDAKIETGDSDELKGVWYYPNTNTVQIL